MHHSRAFTLLPGSIMNVHLEATIRIAKP